MSHVLVEMVRVTADRMYVPRCVAMNLQHVFCKPDTNTPQQNRLTKQGPNSQTILEQSYDDFRTYDNLVTTGEFTEHLQQS